MQPETEAAEEAAEEAAGVAAEEAVEHVAAQLLKLQQVQTASGLKLLMASLCLTLLLLVEGHNGECLESLHWRLPWAQQAQLAQHWTFAKAVTAAAAAAAAGVLAPGR